MILWGIDVSEYVTDVDTAVLKKNGCTFGSVKCCDAAFNGTVWRPFVDKKHLFFTDKLRAASIPTSSYGFCHPTMDMRAFCDFFIAHGYYDQMKLVLDMESLSRDPKTGQQVVPSNAGEWTFAAWDYVGNETGTPPVIYSGLYYFEEMMKQCPDLRRTDVVKWVAAYVKGVGVPCVPTADYPASPWPHLSVPYSCAQLGGDIKLDGVVGLADQDFVVRGDLNDLLVTSPQL